MGGILYDIIDNPQIWLTIILTTYACILPHIIIRRWEVLFSKDIINNLRHKKYQEDFKKKSYYKKIEEVGRFTRFISKFRKIFSKSEDYEPENLTDKKFKGVVDGFRSSRKEKKSSQMNIENIQKENMKMIPSDERQGNYLIEDNNNFYNNNKESPSNIERAGSLKVETEVKDKEKDEQKYIKKDGDIEISKNKIEDKKYNFIDEENKILLKQKSQNITYDEISEFTFKLNPNNTLIKKSIVNNKHINEEEKINKSVIEETDNLENKKRDPFIHDYPFEITNTLEDLI